MTQRVEFLADRGERRDSLDQEWAALLGRIGLMAVPVPNRLDDVEVWLTELEIDGVVLTGGNDIEGQPGSVTVAPERDATERALLASSPDRPVLGVCRGLQFTVVSEGGRLHRVEGHVAVEHRLRVPDDPGLPLVDGREVNSFHDFAVATDGLPGALEALAFAPDGTVEALRHRDRPLVAVMWHPERGVAAAEDLDLIARVLGGPTS